MDWALQAPLSRGFPRQEHWRGFSFPSSGDLPDPGIEPMSPSLAGGFFTTEPPGKPIRDMKLYRGSKTHHHPSDLKIKIFLSLRLYSIPFGRWALLSEGPGYPASGPWMPCQRGRALEGLSLHWQLNAVTQQWTRWLGVVTWAHPNTEGSGRTIWQCLGGRAGNREQSQH